LIIWYPVFPFGNGGLTSDVWTFPVLSGTIAAINSTAKSFASFNSHKVPFVLSAMRATPGQVVGWAGAGAVVGGSILPGAGAAIGAAIGALGCALGLFC
jgi:hypothetical protein